MTDSKTPLDWRESIQSGNFEQAEGRIRALELVGEYHPEMLAAVQAMMALLGAVRSKQFLKALRQVPNLEPLREFLSPEALKGAIENLQQTEDKEINQPEELTRVLQQALDNPYTRAEALNRIGVLHVRLKDAVQARVHFDQAIQADPKHFRAITNLGNLALEAGNNQEAESLYKRALELNPEYHLAHNNLAVLQRKQKRIGDSIKSLKKSQRFEQRAISEKAREESRAQPSTVKFGVIAFYILIAVVVVFLFVQR